jgi:uncharacterized protein
MLTDLPKWIDPKLLASQNQRLQGKVALAELSRVHDRLQEYKLGEVTIDWLFSLDEKRRPTIQGQLQTELIIQCQRCLQPISWSLDVPTGLIFLQYEPTFAEEFPSGFEAVQLEEIPLSLLALIEDEIILALPIVATHDTCHTNDYQMTADFTYRNNPFQQSLSTLRK